MNVQRHYLRAPVQDEIVYVCDEYVLKGKCVNISIGGLLLSDLGRVPDSNMFSILLPLIQYPDFGKTSHKKTLAMDRSSLEIEIVRANVEIVRSFEGHSDIEKVLVNNFGTRFTHLESVDKSLILSFVQTFTKNLIHLLTLFESHGSRGANIAYLRKVSSLLGYNGQAKLAVLRQEVLHDYQSLIDTSEQ